MADHPFNEGLLRPASPPSQGPAVQQSGPTEQPTQGPQPSLAARPALLASRLGVSITLQSRRGVAIDITSRRGADFTIGGRA